MWLTAAVQNCDDQQNEEKNKTTGQRWHYPSVTAVKYGLRVCEHTQHPITTTLFYVFIFIFQVLLAAMTHQVLLLLLHTLFFACTLCFFCSHYDRLWICWSNIWNGDNISKNIRDTDIIKWLVVFFAFQWKYLNNLKKVNLVIKLV